MVKFGMTLQLWKCKSYALSAAQKTENGLPVTHRQALSSPNDGPVESVEFPTGADGLFLCQYGLKST